MNDNITLTPAQKAGKTLHERSERRKQEFRKALLEIERIRETCNEVLADPECLLSDKLRAAEVLAKIRGL